MKLMTKILIISALLLVCDTAFAVIPRNVKVSENDTTPGYLNGKFVAGDNITFTEGSDGANETLTIVATATAAEETDPVFTAWDKSTGISITEAQVSDLGTYLTAETDPEVGTLTNTKWCTSDGSAVNCTADAPAGSGDMTAAVYDTNANSKADDADAVTCTGCVATTEVASGVTLDAEWDSASEINAATTDADFLTSESDPQVDVVTNGNFCKGNGSAVTCTDSNTYDAVVTAGRSLTRSTNDILADAELYTDTKTLYFESPTANDDFKSIWVAPMASTITKISCESDQTVTFDLQVDDGSPAAVNGSDIACTTFATDSTLAGDATIGAGERLDLAVASVSGTPTWVSISWEYTKDD